MVNYDEGKIYMIEPTVQYDEGDIYYGSSTMDKLSTRFASHRQDYKKYKNGKGSKTTSFDLFDKYGIENCKIVLVELCPVKSKDELLSREAYYIRNFGCVNKYIPLRTPAEYRNDNREGELERSRNFRINNPDYHRNYIANRRNEAL